MKNKLLVSVFAMAIAVFALTSCNRKSDVKEVCSDLVKTSLHKSARSLLQLKGETLTISEYEFPSTNVNDNRLIYRTISFGNGTYEAKTVENLTYEYGEWNEDNTQFSLLVNQPGKAPFTLWYRCNALVTPDGRAIGGDGANNSARVEKWEKTLATFPNTDWEATFKDKFVRDSVYRDSIRTRWVPAQAAFVTDTIQIYDHMDTVNADTSCYYRYQFKRSDDLKNTGSVFMRRVRSQYLRDTKTVDTISIDSALYDIEWFFSEVSSDSKFKISLKNAQNNELFDVLDISKYKYSEAYNVDTATQAVDTVVTHVFLLNGLLFKRPKQ